MKKNGFTLIELLATIALLGVLATITITVSVRKINETKESARDVMINSVEFAAQNYVLDYKDKLETFDNNDYIYITLQTLIENEYFTESLIDPITKKSLPLSDEIYVVRESNGKLKAVYDINQREKTKIILNGSYNVYVPLGSEYKELGVTAKNNSNQDVSNQVSISGTVDTNNENKYIITYEIDNVKITRNVIVYKK